MALSLTFPKNSHVPKASADSILNLHTQNASDYLLQAFLTGSMPRPLTDRKFPTKNRHNGSKNPFTFDGLLRRLSIREDPAFFEGTQAQAELKKRRTLHSQGMPNTPNGVRGGQPKRDQKKNQETGSLNGHDLNRRNTEEPPNPIAVIASSSGPLQRLAEIAKYFSSFTYDMQVVEDVYGPEIEKETTIRKLTETVELLTHFKSEELEKLRHENQELLAGRETCQQEKKKCQEITEKLEAENAIAEAGRQKESDRKVQEEITQLEKAFKTRKTDYEDGTNKKIRKVEDNLAKVSSIHTELNKRYKEVEEKLKKEKKQWARLEKSLEGDIEQLTEELKQMKAQFPVDGQPVEYYAQRFQQISDAIKTVSSKYFEKLPEHAMTNADAVQQELCSLSPVFRATPIWPSPVSDFLRMKNVEHIIASCLCDSIWQPFPPGGSLPNHEGLKQFLQTISTSLSASGGRSESVWRVLTLRGINQALGASAPGANNIESTVQRILTILNPLTNPSDSADLKKALLSLLSDSATLWTSARTDSAHITITTEPPSPPDESAWLAQDITTLPPLASPSTSIPSNPPNPTTPPLCLFPLILHKPPSGPSLTTTTTTAAADPTTTTTTIIHQGRALYPSSRACVEGSREKSSHEDDLAQALSDARSRVNKRRISVPLSPSGTGLVGKG